MLRNGVIFVMKIRHNHKRAIKASSVTATIKPSLRIGENAIRKACDIINVYIAGKEFTVLDAMGLFNDTNTYRFVNNHMDASGGLDTESIIAEWIDTFDEDYDPRDYLFNILRDIVGYSYEQAEKLLVYASTACAKKSVKAGTTSRDNVKPLSVGQARVYTYQGDPCVFIGVPEGMIFRWYPDSYGAKSELNYVKNVIKKFPDDWEENLREYGFDTYDESAEYQKWSAKNPVKSSCGKKSVKANHRKVMAANSGNASASKIKKFIEDAVVDLQNESSTNNRLVLDNDLCLYVGYSDGFDTEDGYAICAKIAERNDADWADFDYLNMPWNTYSDNDGTTGVFEGDVYDTEVEITPGEDYTQDAQWLADSYAEIRNLLDDGKLTIEAACGKKSVKASKNRKRIMANTDINYYDLIGEPFNEVRDILTNDGYSEYEYGDKNGDVGYVVYRNKYKEVEVTYEWIPGNRKNESHAGRVLDIYVEDEPDEFIDALWVACDDVPQLIDIGYELQEGIIFTFNHTTNDYEARENQLISALEQAGYSAEYLGSNGTNVIVLDVKDKNINSSVRASRLSTRHRAIKAAEGAGTVTLDNMNTDVIPVVDFGTYGGPLSYALEDVFVADYLEVDNLDPENEDEADALELINEGYDGTDDFFNQVLGLAPLYIQDAFDQYGIPAKVVSGSCKWNRPREYNYYDDTIEFSMTIDTNWVASKFAELSANEPKFADYLNDNYSSRSGFISYMPNEVEGYNDMLDPNSSDYWKVVSAIVMFMVYDDPSIRNDVTEDMIEYLRGNADYASLSSYGIY